MNQLQKVFDGQELKMIERNGEVLFQLNNVCEILSISPRVVKQRLDKDVCSTYPLQTAGGMQNMTFINEDGLYDVILDSRKPEAKKFRKWITSEVLPSIRKDGSYSLQVPQTLPEALRAYADEVEAHESTRKALATAEPKAKYFDALVERKLLTNFRDTAKELHIGQKKFISFLLDNEYVYRDKKRKLKPYMKYVPELFGMKDWERNGKADVQTLITPKGKETFRLLLG